MLNSVEFQSSSMKTTEKQVILYLTVFLDRSFNPRHFVLTVRTNNITPPSLGCCTVSSRFLGMRGYYFRPVEQVFAKCFQRIRFG